MATPSLMLSNMRLIFLNRYFHPDHSATSQMLSDLAFALAERGESVHVVSSRQRYDVPNARLPVRESIRGVEVHRVWTSRFGRHNLMGRVIDYATFYASAAWATWTLVQAGDIVIAKTDPPMLSVLAAPLTRWRGATLINWLQDIFPEVAQAVGLGRGPLFRVAYRIMHSLRTGSLHGASVNVALGERMADQLSALGVAAHRIRIIANWADGELIRPLEHSENRLRCEWGLQNAFVVGYSGNLGRAHEYETLLDAIERIELRAVPQTAAGMDQKRELVWLFVGGGVLSDRFQAEVRRRGLRSVAFRPYQPRERLAESMSAADVHLVSLRPELEGLIVPSKIYSILAAGRPALFIGDNKGEIARLLTRHKCGWTVAAGAGATLAHDVLALSREPALARRMGIEARRAFEAEFDKGAAVARWERLIAELSRPTEAQRRSAAERPLDREAV
jgi:colanic acid biosynthesis glycosyl transferase WcaI